MITTEKVSVAVVGTAGSASGNATSLHPVNGRLVGVYVDYTAQPGTCDTTITVPGLPPKTLLTLTNANTDGWFYPRALVHDEAGTALTGTAGGDRTMHPIDDYVKVAVAQGDPGAVDVYFLIER